MKYGRLVALVMGLGALVAPSAQAQWNVARFDERSNIVYGSYALDPAFVATAGYGRVARVFGHPFQFSADAGMAMAKADPNDYHARLAVRTALVRWRSLAITGSAAFVTRGTENTIYRGFNFGSELAGTAGVYRRGWFVAGEFGFDKAVITHVTHTDWYRRNYYPEAKDGWYLNAGGVFNYGIVTGVAVGRTEWVLRAGYLRTQKWDEMTPPLYASAGVGIGF